MYAASTSLNSAVASTSLSGFSFTWRMYLPVPSSKPAGSGSAAHGSPNGARTRRRKAHVDDTVPNLLVAAGFQEWTRLEKFHEIVDRFSAVLGPDRVGVSADGFNRVARGHR